MAQVQRQILSEDARATEKALLQLGELFESQKSLDLKKARILFKTVAIKWKYLNHFFIHFRK